MSLSAEQIATLSKVSTATITTVLLKKGLRNVWMRGTKPLHPGQNRLVGRAFTLRFVPAREDLATPESWSSPISTRTAIEAMPEGCIAVVDAMGVTDAGIFGDILCARMVKRGVTALITDGVVRDLEGVVGTNLPVWCNGYAAPPSVAGLTFVGWGDGEEAWVIRHDLIMGDTAEMPVWNDLDRALRETTFETEGGRSLKVRAACIDSGGHRGAMVLSFARARASRRIYATKGIGNDHRGSKPIWGKTMMQTRNAGDRLWAVGVDTGKDDLAARLRIVPEDEPTPKAVHFPAVGLSVDYFEQLTSEHAVTEINKEGRKVRRWKMRPGQERNEALDCFVLAEAAMLSLPMRLIKLPPRTGIPIEPEEADVESEVVAEMPPPRPERRRARWGAYS